MKSQIPHQVIEISSADIGTEKEFRTYENFEEIISFEAQIVGANVDKIDNVFMKLEIDNFQYLGAGYPLVNLKGNSNHDIGKRGYIFGSFGGDIPVAKANDSVAKIKIEGTADTADAFKLVRLIFYYKNKTE